MCSHPPFRQQYKKVRDGVRVVCGACGSYRYHLLKGKVVHKPDYRERSDPVLADRMRGLRVNC